MAGNTLNLMPAQQLNLALSLVDDALFDNFLADPQSIRYQVLEMLKNQFKNELIPSSYPSPIFFWGATGGGLTHLLQAACHEAVNKGHSIHYLPLDEMASYSAQDVLQDLGTCQLICLDNIQAVAGRTEWEEALFHLMNEMMGNNGRLLISSNAPPRALSIKLADLESRLGASTIFQLPLYSDKEKATIVKFRAARLGLDFSEEALGFLMNRASRDLSSLITHLHQLDTYALQYQSKATIPLMKKAFNW